MVQLRAFFIRIQLIDLDVSPWSFAVLKVTKETTQSEAKDTKWITKNVVALNARFVMLNCPNFTVITNDLPFLHLINQSVVCESVVRNGQMHLQLVHVQKETNAGSRNSHKLLAWWMETTHLH